MEKRDRLGGSSALSGGWFALSGTALQRRAGVEDSDDLFLTDMSETGGGFADEALLRALVERQANAVAAIDHAGAWTDELKVSADDGRTCTSDPHPRSARASRERGGRRGCRHPSRTRGRWTRHGWIQGGRHRVRAWSSHRGLGGRPRQRGSRARANCSFSFVPDQADAMPYGGVGNTGDGLRMAWMLAGVADIGHVSGTYGQHAETNDDEHELLTANYLGAILVNARGERFADESESYKVPGSAVLSQPGRTAFQDLRLRRGAVEARRSALGHGAPRGARAPS